MATEFDSAGGSKERRTDEEGDQVAEEDRISDLPEALRLHILGLLPFKSAIRTGALSTQWRALWTRRWPAPASLDFRLAPGDSPQPLLDSMERRGRRRLDRFSLSCQIGQLNDKDSGRCLDYAAACAVADLDIHLCKSKKIYNFFIFRLPTGGNPHLARLSLTCIHVGHFPYDSHHYSVLEVIHLHHVTISDESLLNLVAACPLLRTLDIRYCELRCAYLMGAGARLKNVTVAECKLLTDVFLGNLSSLRSFRYSGGYMAADEIPTSSAIDDLYICFGGPACRWLRSRCTIYDARGRLCKFRGCWLGTLISLSNLTVLTVCSSALRRVSAKARARSIAGNAASCKLQNLREVQLLMFAMYNENFNDIMAFLTTCCTLRLERLFVQLPTRSYQYKPYEEPSESEEELSEVETSEEYLSKGEESEEDQSEQYESEEDHANGDESDEDGSEEDHSHEDESDEDHSQEDHSEEDHSQEDDSEEDHPQEADSEEDHSQEGDSEENHSQEDGSEEDHSQEGDSEANHSQEDESEEDQPKENGSEEQGFAEGQSKEDGSKREFSDGGQPLDEPQNGCENLMLLKMTNFMGHHNEMRLVSFVLKKSACLNQLMLFTPESDYQGGPQKDHLNTSDFLQTKLLPLEKSSPNAQIILSEPDAAAIKPLHSETFVKRGNCISCLTDLGERLEISKPEKNMSVLCCCRQGEGHQGDIKAEVPEKDENMISVVCTRAEICVALASPVVDTTMEDLSCVAPAEQA